MEMTDSTYDYLKLAEFFGFQKGDVVFVSSDVKRMSIYELKHHNQRLDLNKFIDSIIQQIGPEGTLLFPVYNWGFCKGETFNYRTTKGTTGSLGNAALERQDFKRTKHPIYSFAVWGKDQDYLCSLDNHDSFEENSPFGYLNRVHAKNLVINVDLTHCYTFNIYLQQKSGMAEYRYIKPFSAHYVDEDGTETERCYSMFVRDYELNMETDYAPIQEQFIKDGVAKEYWFNGIHFMVIDMHKTVEPVLDDIKNNRSRKICKFKGQND